jgi:hypothetical protein
VLGRNPPMPALVTAALAFQVVSGARRYRGCHESVGLAAGMPIVICECQTAGVSSSFFFFFFFSLIRDSLRGFGEDGYQRRSCLFKKHDFLSGAG